MPIRFIKKKPKRKAGTRAGLTKAAIATAAAKLLEAPGAGEFSLRKLAKAMGVVPATVHAHFKGGFNAVSGAIAIAALSDVAPPFKPTQQPADYLREVFWNILKVLHGRPTVANCVVLQISANVLLVPVLAERLLLSLDELGVPKNAQPKMLRRAMGAIFDMILTQSTQSKPAVQKRASLQLDAEIKGLSPTEFPHLAELRKALIAEAASATAHPPSADLAAQHVDRLIAGLGLELPEAS